MKLEQSPYLDQQQKHMEQGTTEHYSILDFAGGTITQPIMGTVKLVKRYK